MKNLSEYKIIPKSSSEIVEVPCFLGGEFGKLINEEIQAKYGKFQAIIKIKYNENSNLIEGSNPFYVIAVNEILRANGLNARTANQADLEKILKTNELSLKRFYEDTALVLRSRDEPNAYSAKSLADSIALRSKQEMPIMIPLTGLELIEDSNSDYGLNFKLRENAELITAPILNKSGHFSSENIDEKTGLPKELSNGNRYLYAISKGLSRLCLDWNLVLNSNWGSLSYSVSGGRVVVVGGEATAN